MSIFRRKTKKTEEQTATAERRNSGTVVSGRKTLTIDPNGLYLLELTPGVRTISAKRVQYKKVILVNADEFQKIHMYNVAAGWNGLGHYEVELMLAFLLVEPILEANFNQKKEADITDLFSSDMTFRGKVHTAEEIRNHIMKSFEVVDETDDCLKVKIA